MGQVDELIMRYSLGYLACVVTSHTGFTLVLSRVAGYALDDPEAQAVVVAVKRAVLDVIAPAEPHDLEAPGPHGERCGRVAVNGAGCMVAMQSRWRADFSTGYWVD